MPVEASRQDPGSDPGLTAGLPPAAWLRKIRARSGWLWPDCAGHGGGELTRGFRTADPFITSAVPLGQEPKWWKADARIRTADPFITSAVPLEQEPKRWKADARIRTADPFITSEVLYQLSYVGEWAILAGRRTRFLGVENARTRDSRAGGEITFFDPRGVQSGARRTDLATFV